MAVDASHFIPQAAAQKEVNELLNIGRDLYEQEYVPYQGRAIAGRTALQRRADQMAAQRGQWQPYLQEAQNLGNRAQQGFDQNYQRYMNPYENAAIRATTQDATRNFTENVLPAIEAKFIRAGQHGASGQRDMIRKMTRDLQSEILARSGQMRAQGYDMASRIHASDQDRLANLARLQASLGSQAQAANISDIGVLQDLGNAQQQHLQNQAEYDYNEWLKQQAWPFERLMMRNALIRGLPFGSSEIRRFAPAPQHQINTAGRLGSLATALLGLQTKGAFG